MMSGMIYRDGNLGNQNFGPGDITMWEIGGIWAARGDKAVRKPQKTKGRRWKRKSFKQI